MDKCYKPWCGVEKLCIDCVQRKPKALPDRTGGNARVNKRADSPHVHFEANGITIYGDPGMGPETKNALVEMINVATQEVN